MTTTAPMVALDILEKYWPEMEAIFGDNMVASCDNRFHLASAICGWVPIA